jgi:hypothetical protein
MSTKSHIKLNSLMDAVHLLISTSAILNFIVSFSLLPLDSFAENAAIFADLSHRA